MEGWRVFLPIGVVELFLCQALEGRRVHRRGACAFAWCPLPGRARLMLLPPLALQPDHIFPSSFYCVVLPEVDWEMKCRSLGWNGVYVVDTLSCWLDRLKCRTHVEQSPENHSHIKKKNCNMAPPCFFCQLFQVIKCIHYCLENSAHLVVGYESVS